ncbi:MAG: hypothetical protein Q3990_08545, partial [Desulfovibrionaceae bacterium]|nr:hypothetical protein [Desulfovibrionaceae bacterium]
MNLKSFFQLNKTVLTIFLIVFILAGTALAVYVGHNLYYFFFPKPHTSISLALQKTKEIDKLYTGIYLIPVLDRQWGPLKRDKWK